MRYCWHLKFHWKLSLLFSILFDSVCKEDFVIKIYFLLHGSGRGAQSDESWQVKPLNILQNQVLYTILTKDLLICAMEG